MIIIGAGAAGLMCAREAGNRGRSVLVIDHANKPGKKILMSGGGRCNFTNYHIQPEAYLSHNPHFCKSALSRYTQWDFIALVEKHKIPYHEKTLGQLFCDNKAHDILNMLLLECEKAHADIRLNTSVVKVEKIKDNHYHIKTDQGSYTCESLVIACGGLSIPTMGASPFGYQLAEQFGLPVWPTRAGLVPFTFDVHEKQKYAELSGIAFSSITQNETIQFKENCLFTHRGISGPAILQISSYWSPGETVTINMLPDHDLSEILTITKIQEPKKQLKTILLPYFAKKIVGTMIPPSLQDKKLGDLSNQDIQTVATLFHAWNIKPNGTEGYRTAEVTLGGVDCDSLSSKTMETLTHKGLYFIGEVVDVTGWLGGYNFQWAWASGVAAGHVC